MRRIVRVANTRHSREDFMIADDDTVAGPFGRISRRSAIGSTLLAGAAFLAADSTSAQEPRGAHGRTL